jgi:hypothetical protein
LLLEGAPNGRNTVVLRASDPRVVLHWTIDDTDVDIQLSASVAGWVSFGIGSSMRDADIIMGSPSSVLDMFSTDFVAPTADATQNLLSSSCTRVNGITTLSFERYNNTNDVTNDKPLSSGTYMVAWSTTSDSFTSKHTGAMTFQLQLFGGGNTSAMVVSSSNLRGAHGLLMFFGWAVVIAGYVVLSL